MPKQSDIYTLGIHDGHNAGAALLKNGHITAAISEERLTGVKNQAGVPVLSIQKVLDIAGVNPEDITLVSVASSLRVVGDPAVESKLFLFNLHQMLAPWMHSTRFISLAVKLLQRLPLRRDLFAALQTVGIVDAPLFFIDHHRAHAASTYYQRPWKGNAVIFTLDGMGDGLSATVSIGDGMDITRISSSSYYDSICNNAYTEITRYLGMKRDEHEYKVMGLAPYGDPAETVRVFHNAFRLNPTDRLRFENRTRRYMENLEPYYRKHFRYKRFDHVAAGVQKFFEDIVCAWVQEGIARTGIRNVCVAGGGFLNVKANMLLRELREVNNFFVYPAANDGGLPVGAAIMGYVQYCDQYRRAPAIFPIGSIYYGQHYTSAEIGLLLKKTKWGPHAGKATADEVADLLAHGNSIGRFAGRDEWGPRALGNRSILADPRQFETVMRLNSAIKHRDFWMPFAPAILEEDQSRYLRHARFSPYMTEAFSTTDKSSEISATVHPADRTARPMTVNQWNSPFRDILRAFKKITGVGALLNTSFNLHGYPLVGTPEQAIHIFEHSALDGLILEDWLIRKK